MGWPNSLILLSMSALDQLVELVSPIPHASCHIGGGPGSEAAGSGHRQSGSTFPVEPSTVTRIPVRRREVASTQPTTAGIPYSRAMIEACDAALPTSVTTAAALVNSGVHAGAVSGATRISPA